MSLKDKVVLITGGGTGIGADAAHRFRAAGARVVLNGRRADRLSKTASSVDPTCENVAWVAGDIGKPETSQRIVQTAVARFGGITAGSRVMRVSSGMLIASGPNSIVN